MEYLDLNLDIFPEDGSNSLQVRLECPTISFSEVRSTSPPLTATQISGFLSSMERIAQKPKPEDKVWLENIGTRLYSALFSDDWKSYCQQIFEKCQQQGCGLRINIGTQGKLAEDTPWELLYDSESKQFLGCAPLRVIVRSPDRSLRGTGQVITPERPIRILVASASPPRYSSVHPDLEIEAIQERLSELPKQTVSFFSAPRVSWNKFLGELQGIKPHLLHLIAHGNETGVFFEEGNNVDYGTLVNQFIAIQNLRVVFISGCNSRHILSHREPFDTHPIVPSIHSIWALLVTGTNISSSASLSFIKFLYTALAAGFPLIYAVGSARNSLAGSNTSDSYQWSIPMLHNACNIVLFPPMKDLQQLTNTSPLRHEQILELRQKIEDALGSLSALRESINSPRLSPANFKIWDDEPRLIDPFVIEEVIKQLNQISDYPNSLVSWIDTTRTFASQACRGFEECALLIGKLAKLKRLNAQNIQAIQQCSEQAYCKAEQLNIQFEKLLHIYNL